MYIQKRGYKPKHFPPNVSDLDEKRQFCFTNVQVKSLALFFFVITKTLFTESKLLALAQYPTQFPLRPWCPEAIHRPSEEVFYLVQNIAL